MIGMFSLDAFLIYKCIDLEHMGYLSLLHSYLDMILYVFNMLPNRL